MGKNYSEDILYEYTISGKRYTGSYIEWFASSRSYSTAHAIVDKYPEGKSVEVFYDPLDHSSCLLEVVYGGAATTLFVFFAAFSIASIVAFLIFVDTKNSKRKP